MSRIITRKVETLRISCNSDKFNFGNLLLSERLINKSLEKFGKSTELSNIEDHGRFITCTVITTRKTSIPPKRNTKFKITEQLDFDNNEGLAYGNALLYDKELNILLYEINKNGTFINDLLSFIMHYCSGSEEFGRVMLVPRILLNIRTYEKVLRMKYYKSFEFEIAQPEKIIAENDSAKNYAQITEGSNSDKMYLKFSISGHKKESLLATFIQKSINLLDNLSFTDSKGSVTKMRLHGLEEDPHNDVELIPSFVDLITDKFICEIKIEEPTLASDVQQEQRKNAIIEVYNRNLADFELILNYDKSL